MKYKLIAIDLDGTLLTEKKKVPAENKAVLRELMSRGIEVIIATGRRYYSAKELIAELEMDEAIIMANNGTIVRDMKTDDIITTRYFDHDDFYNLIREGKERELHAITHVDHFSEGYDILVELEKNDRRYKNYLNDIANRYRTIGDLLRYSNPKALAIVYTGEFEQLREFQYNLNNKYKGKFNAYLMHNLTNVGTMLEVINSRGNKWVSVMEYAMSKGIKSEEIIALGDDNNDIEMIKNAGLGIAMKNATKEVKDASDIISEKTNDESGVGFTLKEVFKL